DPEFCSLPCGLATGEEAEKLRALHPDAVIAELAKKGVAGAAILYEAIFEERFRQFLLEAVSRRRRFKWAAGEVFAFLTQRFQVSQSQAGSPLDASSVKVDRTNASIT